MSVKLVSPEQFRDTAMKSALDWYEFAKKATASSIVTSIVLSISSQGSLLVSRACLDWLRGFSGGHKQSMALDMEYKPELSQPFHPSDIINRFLLGKVHQFENAAVRRWVSHDIQNPDDRVAITHDDD
ncbi:hypothetical protein L210DRAFT_3651185 [Boletus edulis BED1]|uniref:Uncharacterized protein n=1 Tax=Boletus edulis BED1 TaxID=1328754 RepID=A0AAD4G908_BOLED|nr:hypothetical protein L210DRAFT_3651185 [Boletus edulis BED1]